MNSLSFLNDLQIFKNNFQNIFFLFFFGFFIFSTVPFFFRAFVGAFIVFSHFLIIICLFSLSFLLFLAIIPHYLLISLLFPLLLFLLCEREKQIKFDGFNSNSFIDVG